MWINPMLSIWLYATVGSLILCSILLWKWYKPDEEDEK